MDMGWGDWGGDSKEGKYKFSSNLILKNSRSIKIPMEFYIPLIECRVKVFLYVYLGVGAEDEKRKQREEKRLARQKEIEAKRAARKGGALKLGSKMS